MTSAPVRYIRDLGARPALTVRAHELLACLPPLAERTEFQLRQLHADCTVDRCDLMVRALHEVQTVIRRLSEELQRGESPTV